MLWLTLQKLKPTIDPVKCRYIKVEEITQNAWNALMRIGGSIDKLYPSYEGYNLSILPPFLVNAFLSTNSSAIIPLIYLLFPEV